MNRINLFIQALLLFFLMGFSCFVYGQTVANPNLTMEEMVYDADTIIHGRIAGKHSYRMERTGVIVTDYEITLYETIFDSPVSSYLKEEKTVIQFVGGTIGNRTERIGHIPTFEVGEEVVLFLKEENKQDFSPLVGLYQGYFSFKERTRNENLDIISDIKVNLNRIKSDSRYDRKVSFRQDNRDSPSSRRSTDNNQRFRRNFTTRPELPADQMDFYIPDAPNPFEAGNRDTRRGNDSAGRDDSGIFDGEIFDLNHRYSFFADPPASPITWYIHPSLYEGEDNWGLHYEFALAEWNRYSSGLNQVISNPAFTIGDQNGRFDVALLNNDQCEQIFGFRTGAVAFCRVIEEDDRIIEADVVFMTTYNWTTDIFAAYNSTDLYYFMGIAAHEIGHAYGIDHPWGGFWDAPPSFDQNALTVMMYARIITRPGGERVFDTKQVVLMRKLYMMDGWAIRNAYPARAVAINDFGVHLIHKTSGMSNVHWSEFPATSSPGGTFTVRNVVAENVGTVAGTRRVNFYLTDRPLTWTGSTYYHVGFQDLPQLSQNQYLKFDKELTVPAGVPLGEYYLAVDIGSDDHDANRSGWSSAKIRITAPPPPPPNAPSNLTVANVTPTSISLSWRDNSNNEAGFTVERRLYSAGGTITWSRVRDVGANVTTFQNTGLNTNTRYEFRVKAFNEGGSSEYSNAVDASTADTVPLAPSDVRASVNGTTSIRVSWRNNATNHDGFRVYRSMLQHAGFEVVAERNLTAYNYIDTGLLPNTVYYYRVVAFNSVGESVYSSTVSDRTLNAPPAAPSNLSATPLSASIIRLSWTDNCHNEHEFGIDRHSGNNQWEEVGRVDANITEYEDRELNANTRYYYRVKARNERGISDYSNTADARTQNPPPAAPSNLTATAYSNSFIEISWQDNSDDEQGFRIERRIGEDGEWTYVHGAAANSTSTEHHGLAANTTYYFRVRSWNAGGDSQWSNVANATTWDNPPAAPSNLQAWAVSNTRINLSWTDNSDNELVFQVYYKEEGEEWTWLTNHAANVTTLQHLNRTPDTRYYYRVRAANATGASAWSNEASAFTAETLPLAPSNLWVTVWSASQLNIGWDDNSHNEQGFRIERKTGEEGEWNQIAQVGANVRSYQSGWLNEFTTYYYRVRAYNDAGNSDYTNEAHGTTLQIIPAAPSNLSATAISETRVDLSWTDNANSELGFLIERKLRVDGQFIFIGQTNENVTVYEDTGVVASRQYFYQVRAWNGNGNSNYSNEAGVATPGVPTTPHQLVATAISNVAIRLNWNHTALNEEGFHLERRTGDGEWEQILEAPREQRTHDDLNLTPNTGYEYRIRAFNATGNSNYTTVASATTYGPPNPPAYLGVTSTSLNEISLSWVDSSHNEMGFRLERKTDNSFWEQIDELEVNTTTYDDSDLEPDTRYYYRVRAYNGYGNSDFSNIADTLTTSVLTAPSNLQATALSPTSISLSWQDANDNESGFKIQGKTADSFTWEYLATVGTDTTTYVHTGLEHETEYDYRVYAFNAEMDSELSNAARATTFGKPEAPSGLTAKIISPSRVDLQWTDNSDIEQRFFIQRREQAGVETNWFTVGSTDADITYFSDTGYVLRERQYYRVLAYNEAGVSEASNVVEVVTDYDNTDEGLLLPTGGSGDLYSGTIGGATITFKPDDEETDDVDIEVVLSSNPDFPAIQLFSNPTAIGRYFGFIVSNAEILRNGVSISLDFAARPNQLWFRPGAGSWVQIPDVAIDWTDPLRPVILLDILFAGGRGYRNEYRSDLFEFAGDGGGAETLPVELSSFHAALNASGFVELKWVTETETNMLGYNVLRGLENKIEATSVINRTLIQAYNTSQRREYTYTDRDVQQGESYYYWLQTYDFDLTSSFYGPIYIHLSEEGEEGSIPGAELITELIGAYPNPFNPGTNIRFSLSEKVDVSIRIYNMKGQLINILTENVQYDRAAGHSIYWDGKDDNGKEVGSGVYLYHLKAGSYEAMKKMLLVK